MKNIPIITWIQRQWMLLIVFFITNWACLTEVHFKALGKWSWDEQLGGIWRPATPLEFCGPLLWAVPFGIATYLLMGLAIHLHYRATIDADTNDGTYAADWKACTSWQRVIVANAVRIGIFVGLCILLAGLARAYDVPDQAARWKAATVNPKSRIALDVAVALYQRNQYRYEQIANIKPNTIPPVVIFAIHLRESDNNFKTNLGQGDSLQHRTIHVPKGRIPDKEPPYTFEEAAADALFVTDHMDKQDWHSTQGTLQATEAYNGIGVQKYHPGYVSGYLWAATSLYKGGKYSSDGKWNPMAHDAQLGACALWKAMQAHGIDVGLPWPIAQ